MQILTRKIGESLLLGNEITVTVLDIRDGQIRLGIEAPSDVPIHPGKQPDRDGTEPPGEPDSD